MAPRILPSNPLFRSDAEEQWLTTGVFPSPDAGAVVSAPGSRNQELKALTLAITNWATNPETFPF